MYVSGIKYCLLRHANLSTLKYKYTSMRLSALK